MSSVLIPFFALYSDESDASEESESEEEEKPLKIRKVEKEKPGRKSKRSIIDSEESEDEVLAKRVNRRASNRQSRKNSPEPEEASRPNRRSSKKFIEESPSERRASKRSMDAFNASSLSILIDDIIKNQHSWPFLKPVSVNEVPDYFEVIKKPMDFGKVKSKLNLGDYRTNEQVMRDVELVFFNCDLYNVAASEIYV
jgi:bromodomain adjacent to zinc finger domain protein 1A